MLSSESETPGSKEVVREPWICHVNGVTCEWTITSEELLPKKIGESMFSPYFQTSDSRNKWRLKFCPRGENERAVDYMSCYLYLESSGQLGILAKIKISIWKCNNILVERSCTHKFDILEGWGWPKFSEESKLFSPDCSDIKIILHINADTVAAKEQLSGDFRLLVKDPKFSDVTIGVKRKRFPAHRAILSVRSPVFAAMFAHEEMEENRKKQVKIGDMEPAVVEGMLEFIYTGEVAEIDGLANGLLAAAEKYDLQVLKALCEQTLRKNIEVNNAAEILMQANLYRAAGLKEFAMKFIKDNLYDVTQTDGYKGISDLALLKEIISFGLQKK